jgi:2-polyprenyl-3-methyl-5-hydroxy-6-metoxy-1,4-benzoquinol methylase
MQRNVRRSLDALGRCPSCGSPATLHYRVRDLNNRITDETFEYYRCRACALVFLFPVPENLAEYYPSDYTAYVFPATLAELAAAAQGERYRLELVRHLVPAGRLLDIGPGYGAFAYLARTANYEVETIEMDSRCCAFLRDVVGVPSINAIDVQAALRLVQPCDIVTMFHVLEHLPDPWAVLASIADRLKPGGVLLAAAPNPDALQARVLGRHWSSHIDAPRHLQLIPLDLLAARMRTAGLEPELKTMSDQGSLNLNRFGWQRSLMNLSDRPWPKYGWRIAGRLVHLALSPIEGTLLPGSAYTIAARKPA